MAGSNGKISTNYVHPDLREKSEAIINILNDTSIAEVKEIFNYVETFFTEQKITLKSQQTLT